MASTLRPSFYGTPQVYVSPELQAQALQKLLKEVYDAGNFKDWRQQFNAYPLLNLIKQGSTTKERITWDYVYGTNATTYYSDYTAPVVYSGYAGDTNLTTSPTWERKVAEVGMIKSMYSSTVTIESLEQQGSVIYGNANEAAKDLLSEKIAFALTSFGITLNSLIYSNSAECYGIEYFFKPDLLTYANIPMRLASYTSKVDGIDYFSQWRPLVGTADYSAETLTLNDEGPAAATVETLETGTLASALEQFDIAIQKKKRKYSIILANPDRILEYQRAYRQQVVINMNSGDRSKAEVAMQTPTFQGRQFFPDPNLPSNVIYFLDTSDMEFVNLFPYNLSEGSNVSFFNPTSLAINVGSIPSVGTIFKRQYQIAMLTPRMIVKDMAGLNKLILQA